jgi:hypothetical protein
MNPISRRAIDGVLSRPICQLRSSQERLPYSEALRCVVHLVMIGLMLLVFSGRMVLAEGLSPDKFRRMVQTQLERSQAEGTDSVGTALKVTVFGDPTRDFMLAPIIRNDKVVAVYKDDPKRNGVTPLANAAVLKSVRLDLFSETGARQVLQDRGYTSGDPIAVSVGPCSLFGVLETGWYLLVGESFVLLSLEGRIVSESDVAHFWPGKLAMFGQIRERLLPKE